jgi:hypothetical protein
VSDIIHQKFLESLEESTGTVWLFARWLWNMGVGVYVPPTTSAETREESAQHSDNGDLWIRTEKGWSRVECKRLGYEWTGLKDWPWKPPRTKRAQFYVCSKHSFDNAKQKPYCYLYLNPKGTHMAQIFPGLDVWWVMNVRDGRTGEVQPTYVIDPKNVIFSEFEL